MADGVDITIEPAGGGRLAVTARNGEVRFADRCDPQSETSRARMLQKLEQAFPTLDLADLEQRLLAQLDRAQATHAPDPTKTRDPSAESDQEIQRTPRDVIEDAKSTLETPGLIGRISEDIEATGVVGEYGLALSLYLLGTSRLLAKPLAGIVQGSSSSGKSHVVETVARLFPREQVLMATDMTPNALYYIEQGGLRHKLVVAGERSRVEDDDRAESTRALREMLSSGVLRKVLPQKTDDGMQTIVIENEGPIAFVESTTLAEIFEEDRNRALLLASDDSDAQTRAVVLAIAEHYAGRRAQDVDRVRMRHQTMQRLLRRVDVRVPFAVSLGRCIPADRPDARRVIGQALTMVQAVALLHQFQRAEDPQHGTVIDATVDDYRIARELLIGPVGRALGNELPEHVQSFAAWLRSAVKPGESFKLADLLSRPGCRWSKASIYGLAKPLQTGFLTDAGSDGRATLWRVTGDIQHAAATWLPDASGLEVGDDQ